MTLPTSGPLSLADIQAEFGGSNPISLNEYYAGGAYVPAGVSGTYGAVPSSGTISIQNFYGTSAYLDQQTINPAYSIGPSPDFWEQYGYIAPSFGTISDGTFNVKGGATIDMFLFETGPVDSALTFRILGVHTDDGWTNLNVGGYDYARVDATFYTTGTTSFWQWQPVVNPFSVVGSNTVATFT